MTIGTILGWILLIFELFLIARVILDWSTVLAGPPAWGGVRQKITQVVVRATEPVLAPVRKLIPPLRVGGIGIDLAFIIVFIVVGILRSVVSQF
jgi:YggT family protein